VQPPSIRAHVDAHDVTRIVALWWLIGIGTYLGVVLLRDLADPERLALRDFFCFWRAGELALGGGTGYEQVDRTFANPPFAIPLVEALALLSPRDAFFAIGVVTTVLAAIGMAVLGGIEGMDPRFRVTGVVLAVTTPSFVSALHLGQLTGLYVGLTAVAVWGLVERKDVPAGIATGLLLVKPPLALALLGLGTLLRPRAFTLAWAGTALLLVLSSLPFGLSTWTAWNDVLAALVERHETTPDSWRKQFTVYAFLRTLLSWPELSWPGGSREHARLAASAVSAAFAIPLARTLWSARALRDEAGAKGRLFRVRVASIAVLATIALNLYLFYYDAALAVIPTVFLFSHRSAWCSRARWWTAVVLASLIWLAELLPMLWQGGPSPIGPMALAWAGLELVELARLTHASPLASSPPPDQRRGNRDLRPIRRPRSSIR
jgi:hypothetical protein